MDHDSAIAVDRFSGHPMSYTTTHVQVFFEETLLGSGTAFVMSFAGEYFLVTNWHVLSGRNPIDGSCISRHGGIPNKITFHVAVSEPFEDSGKTGEAIFFKPINLDIYHDEDMSKPIWFDEKDEGNHNDFAVITLKGHVPELEQPGVRLRAIPGGRVVVRSDKSPKGRFGKARREDIFNLYPPVGYQLFILGYPNGISHSGVFPIWKSGTVASEPTSPVTLAEIQTSDVFFADALTRSGMSGAPVLCIQRVGETLFTEDGIGVTVKEEGPLLVGVYAGREGVTQTEAELALGRVWKVGAIERLIAKVIASRE